MIEGDEPRGPTSSESATEQLRRATGERWLASCTELAEALDRSDLAAARTWLGRFTNHVETSYGVTRAPEGSLARLVSPAPLTASAHEEAPARTTPVHQLVERPRDLDLSFTLPDGPTALEQLADDPGIKAAIEAFTSVFADLEAGKKPEQFERLWLEIAPRSWGAELTVASPEERATLLARIAARAELRRRLESYGQPYSPPLNGPEWQPSVREYTIRGTVPTIADEPDRRVVAVLSPGFVTTEGIPLRPARVITSSRDPRLKPKSHYYYHSWELDQNPELKARLRREAAARLSATIDLQALQGELATFRRWADELAVDVAHRSPEDRAAAIAHALADVELRRRLRRTLLAPVTEPAQGDDLPLFVHMFQARAALLQQLERVGLQIVTATKGDSVDGLNRDRTLVTTRLHLRQEMAGKISASSAGLVLESPGGSTIVAPLAVTVYRRPETRLEGDQERTTYQAILGAMREAAVHGGAIGASWALYEQLSAIEFDDYSLGPQLEAWVNAVASGEREGLTREQAFDFANRELEVLERAR